MNYGTDESPHATSYLAPFPSCRGVLVKLSLLTMCLCVNVGLIPLIGLNPRTLDCEIWHQKTRNITISCGTCTTHFDILNRLSVNRQCDRLADRQTDGRQNDHINSLGLTTSAKNDQLIYSYV